MDSVQNIKTRETEGAKDRSCLFPIRSSALRCNVSPKAFKKALLRLKEEGLLTYEVRDTGTVVTILSGR